MGCQQRQGLPVDVFALNGFHSSSFPFFMRLLVDDLWFFFFFCTFTFQLLGRSELSWRRATPLRLPPWPPFVRIPRRWRAHACKPRIQGNIWLHTLHSSRLSFIFGLASRLVRDAPSLLLVSFSTFYPLSPPYRIACFAYA